MKVTIEVSYQGQKFTLTRDLQNNEWKLASDDVSRTVALQGLRRMAQDMHTAIYGESDTYE